MHVWWERKMEEKESRQISKTKNSVGSKASMLFREEEGKYYQSVSRENVAASVEKNIGRNNCF
jgi:hypothetical protein